MSVSICLLQIVYRFFYLFRRCVDVRNKMTYLVLQFCDASLMTFHVIPDSIYIAKVLICFKQCAVLLECGNVIIDATFCLVCHLNEGVNLLMEVRKVSLMTFHIIPDSINIIIMCFRRNVLIKIF